MKLQLNAFWLKIIAILGMTCNHIAHILGSTFPMGVLAPLYALGGLTYPIMAYLMVEGYKKTSNLKRYMLRLLIFALITQIPYSLAFGTRILNVLFTLLLGLITLWLRDRIKNKALFYAAFVGIIIVSTFCDWGGIGVPLLYAFASIKGEKKRIIFSIAGLFVVTEAIFAAGLIMNGSGVLDMLFIAVSLLVIPLLLSYNGQRGYGMKYLFYLFYPLHLLILWIITII